MNLICPYTENCMVYKNWTEKVNLHPDEGRIDIIRDTLDKRIYCIALDALKDPSSGGGVPANKKLSKRLGLKTTVLSYVPFDMECSHITLLTLLRTK